MIKANFFWHGPALSLYESACLASFVRNNIEVRLHSFNADLQVPHGVQLLDAHALARPDEVHAYHQGGQQGSIAAFTDIFRYRVLAREPGWWFDTDVFCLKDGAAFAALETQSKGLLLGLEEPGKVNGAVLYVSRPELALQLEQRANAIGKVFDWGAIGPGLVTQFHKDFPEQVTLLAQSHFYPVHYLEVQRFFRPEEKAGCIEAAQDAVCVHLWNEFLRRWNIPKNILPCEGSYLAELFAQVDLSVARTAALPALPLGSFEALRAQGEIGRTGHKALRLIHGLKKFHENVFGRRL